MRADEPQGAKLDPPAKSRGFYFYQPTPINRGTGMGEGLLGSGAAGPVFLHAGTTFVEPTGVEYAPTEG